MEILAVVIGCIAFGSVLTWWSVSGDAVRQRGRSACEARARARAGDAPVARVALDDAGAPREGVLVVHPEWIGFFPATTETDIIIARSSLLSISTVRDPRWVDPLLRIQYLTDRVEVLVFHAGPDLSRYVDHAEAVAELPRAIASIKAGDGD